VVDIATRPAIEFSIGIMPSSASPFWIAASGVLESRARQRLAIGIDLARRDVGIGTGLALKCDFQFAHVLSVTRAT